MLISFAWCCTINQSHQEMSWVLLYCPITILVPLKLDLLLSMVCIHFINMIMLSISTTWNYFNETHYVCMAFLLGTLSFHKQIIFFHTWESTEAVRLSTAIQLVKQHKTDEKNVILSPQCDFLYQYDSILKLNEYKGWSLGELWLTLRNPKLPLLW